MQIVKWYSSLPKNWPSSKIRETFIQYFKSNNHEIVPSSSVIPKKDDGTYFVNAGMNQFKPVFLGSSNVSFKRAANSQKCIRVGGKHNDLEEVGKDHYHHTFFEMLGNWSFNDYFKKEACFFAWDLLTNVFKLPSSQLYVTYFNGCSNLGINEDQECLEIWKNIGVPRSHIIPQGIKDNFWLMGDTGPCGPCTEIHYSRSENANASSLVNSGSPDVIEIWNIVFMQYDKQVDGTVKKLSTNNIDTGMGLERLTSVLQNKISNYDTDLFVPILQHIQAFSNCRTYSGLLNDPVDIAYRTIADHARMYTVAISDGLLPGRKESQNKLRNIIYRCIHEAVEVLKCKPGLVGELVPVVADSLSSAFPELALRTREIKSIIDETEDKYSQSIKLARKVLIKALKHHNSPTYLSAEQVLDIVEGRFGGGISYDFINLLSKEFKIQLPSEESVYTINKELKFLDHISPNILNNGNKFDSKDVQYFIDNNLPLHTNDSYKYQYEFDGTAYKFPEIIAKVVAIRNAQGKYIKTTKPNNRDENFSIIFDQTNFYSTSGGQTSDFGVIKLKSSDVQIGKISNASKHFNFVVHNITDVQEDITVGSQVKLNVNREHRTGCMLAHTATHILSFCLNKVLQNVKQHGSSLTANQLSFEFFCSKATVTLKELQLVSQLANQIVSQNLAVTRNSMPFDKAVQLENITYLLDKIYPKEVYVVSIGDLQGPLNTSLELCAGTHVANTSHIGEIVITNFEGSVQGSKKLVAVTGSLAKQSNENAKEIYKLLNKVNKTNQHDFEKNIKEINNLLSSGQLLPKFVREDVLGKLKHLQYQGSCKLNIVKSHNLEKMLEIALEESSDHIISLSFDKNREMIDLLVNLSPKFPIFIISTKSNENKNIFGLAYVPREIKSMSVTRWVRNICKNFPKAEYSSPKGKYAKQRHICVFSIPTKNRSEDCSVLLDVAREFKLNDLLETDAL